MSEAVRFVILGAVIGSNNLATALALGAAGQRQRRIRITAVFGLTEFLIPLVGIWIGQQAALVLTDRASVASGVLLIVVGAWTVATGMRTGDDDTRLATRVTTWGGLVLLALVLSADNLVIGFSLGLAGTEPLVLAATIAAFSATFTLLGLEIGSAARSHWGNRAQILGGALLAVIGASALLGLL